MTSTFRLTRAEFKKIFKRASIYIMALQSIMINIESIFIQSLIKNKFI